MAYWFTLSAAVQRELRSTIIIKHSILEKMINKGYVIVDDLRHYATNYDSITHTNRYKALKAEHGVDMQGYLKYEINSLLIEALHAAMVDGHRSLQTQINELKLDNEALTIELDEVKSRLTKTEKLVDALDARLAQEVQKLAEGAKQLEASQKTVVVLEEKLEIVTEELEVTKVELRETKVELQETGNRLEHVEARLTFLENNGRPDYKPAYREKLEKIKEARAREALVAEVRENVNDATNWSTTNIRSLRVDISVCGQDPECQSLIREELEEFGSYLEGLKDFLGDISIYADFSLESGLTQTLLSGVQKLRLALNPSRLLKLVKPNKQLAKA